MTAPCPKDPDANSVWATPVILGAMIAAGLIIALIGDGVWDAFACLLLFSTLSYAAFSAFASKS